MSSRDRPFLAPGDGSIRDPVECFRKSPLTLSLSPRGERTLEHRLRLILGFLRPSGRRTG